MFLKINIKKKVFFLYGNINDHVYSLECRLVFSWPINTGRAGMLDMYKKIQF